MADVNFQLPPGLELNDAQYDGPGRRLAAAGEDGVLRVLAAGDATGAAPVAAPGALLGELRGHRSAVLSVSWATGRFAALLASGSEDGQVIVWREDRPREWQISHQINVTGAANVVAFCPPEHGLMLAVAGGDDLGVLTMLSRRDAPGGGQGQQAAWQVRSFPAHPGGVAALTWAPSKSAATMATGPAVGRAANFAPCRLASCGMDGAVSIWHCDPKAAEGWRKQAELAAEAFCGLPRDVAWRPNVGLPCNQVAACTDQGHVAVWMQDLDGQPWRLQSCWKVPGDARRLAWSRSGVLLSVSVDESDVIVFREVAGEWQQVGELRE